MGRRTLLNFVGALVLCAAAAVGAAAQDVQRSYNLPAGGSVEIANVSGDVNLSGYEGSAVVVSASSTRVPCSRVTQGRRTPSAVAASCGSGSVRSGNAALEVERTLRLATLHLKWAKALLLANNPELRLGQKL